MAAAFMSSSRLMVSQPRIVGEVDVTTALLCTALFHCFARGPFANFSVPLLSLPGLSQDTRPRAGQSPPIFRILHRLSEHGLYFSIKHLDATTCSSLKLHLCPPSILSQNHVFNPETNCHYLYPTSGFGLVCLPSSG